MGNCNSSTQQIEATRLQVLYQAPWLKLTGAWTGVVCAADYAWFNAETSPQLLAIAITARATETQV